MRAFQTQASHTNFKSRRRRRVALILTSVAMLVLLYAANPRGRHYAMVAFADLVGQFDPPPAASEHVVLLRDATRHLYNEEWDEAYDIYERLCAEDPGNELAWYGLGVCLHQFRDYHGAIEANLRVVSDPLAAPMAQYRLATEYALTGQDDLAVQALERAYRTGFRDVARAEREAALNPIRDDPRFVIPPAPELLTFTTADGKQLKYWCVLPRDFDPDRAYPALLAFSGSFQDQAMTDIMLDKYWGMQAHCREWIVISPIAVTERAGFAYAGDHLLIPELLDDVQSRFAIEGDRFHLAGFSNGGSTAFMLATQFPERFQSVTTFPVFEIRPGVMEQLARMEGMTISLFYGELDDGPSPDATITLHDRLEDLGIESTLTVMDGQTHEINSLAGDRFMVLMDRIRAHTFTGIREIIAQ